MADKSAIENTLRINLEFSTGKWNQQVKGAANQLNQLNKRVSTVDRNTQKATKSFISFGDALQFITVTNALPYLKDTALALDRVENRMKFATNSTDEFNQAMRLTEDTANKLGLALVETQRGFATISASAQGTTLEGQPVVELFNAVSNASAALSLSADETNSVFLAFSQIISKGKVAAEELRGQIGERLPGAFNAAARSLGVTNQELDKMLQDGTVLAEDFLPKFATELNRVFGDQALKNADSLTATFNRILNVAKQLTSEAVKYEEETLGALKGWEAIAQTVKTIRDAQASDEELLDFQFENLRKSLVDIRFEAEQFRKTGLGDVYASAFEEERFSEAIKKFNSDVISSLGLLDRQSATFRLDKLIKGLDSNFDGTIAEGLTNIYDKYQDKGLLKDLASLTNETLKYNNSLKEEAEESSLVVEELGKLRALRAENEQSLKKFNEQEITNKVVDDYKTQLALQEASKKVFEQQTAELRAQKKQIEDNIRAQSGISFIDAITKGSGRDIKLDIQASAIERQGGLIADDILQEQLNLLGEINDKLTTLEQIQEVN